MLRRKKAKAEPAPLPEKGPEPVAIAEIVAEPQAEKAKANPADRFRSWITDRHAGYERLTDEKAKLLVLKFAGKPSEEVLAKLKEGGFRYQPEYFGQDKVWTRRNDFEGRERVRAIEALVRGPGAEILPF